MMGVDSVPGQSLALRFRHLAGELRRADGHPNADREFERLLMRMTRALKDSFNERQLPVPILNALDADKSSGLNLFWEVQLAISVVGYWDPCVYTEPYEDYDDKTRYGGQRAVFLKPGPVSSVWPGVFEDILCHDGWCCDDIDLQAIFSMALTEQRFTIMGYYATACDLLAEWIENHADDDRGDRAGEQTVEPFPNDGLDEEGKAFEWGGRRFDRLTGGMMRVLELLHDECKKGHPNVPSAVISRRANVSIDSGVKSQVFKVNRKDWPIDPTGKKPLHPVSEIVIDNGDGTYRLIDPDKVPAKVPAGS